MAGWDNTYPPPRTSSRIAPGIFVNVEFGVSFSHHDRAHTGAFRFGSKTVQDKVQRKREEQFRQQRLQRQQQEELFFESTPTSLMPANGFYMQGRPRDRGQEQRPQRLAVNTPYQRGSSAPPTLSDRHIPLSPIGPISPIGGFAVSPVSPMESTQPMFPTIGIQHTTSLPLDGYERASRNGPQQDYQREYLRPTRSMPREVYEQQTRSMPLAGYERPLPAAPSQFRLGEDGLPWSTEPFYRPHSPEYVRPQIVDIELENGRGEDPQRVRELESLQQAMMTVDTLPNDGLDSWSWDSVGDIPRGPRSIGWAVRSENTRSTPISPPPPPPYVVSQWMVSEGYDRYRPRSSG